MDGGGKKRREVDDVLAKSVATFNAQVYSNLVLRAALFELQASVQVVTVNAPPQRRSEEFTLQQTYRNR